MKKPKHAHPDRFAMSVMITRVWDPKRHTVHGILSAEIAMKPELGFEWKVSARTAYVLEVGYWTHYAQCFGVN